MLEYAGTRFSTKLSPSGVPFIEMLESKSYTKRFGFGPSGVPFIEMLE